MNQMQESLLSIIRDEPYLDLEPPSRPTSDQENFQFWPLKIEMNTNDKLSDDFMEHHPTTFTCKLCKEAFASSENLKAHQQSDCASIASEVVNGKRIYVCEMCTRSFKRAEHLKRHEQSHSGSKPFKCDECGTSFRRNEHLKRHMFSHLDVKPFSCHVCDRGFNRKEHLKRHEKSHREYNELQDLPDLKA